MCVLRHFSVHQKHISIISIERRSIWPKMVSKEKRRSAMHVNHKWPDPDHDGERSHHKQMVEQMPDAATSMCWRRVWWFSSSSCWGPSPFWSTVSYRLDALGERSRKLTASSFQPTATTNDPKYQHLSWFFTSAYFSRNAWKWWEWAKLIRIAVLDI